MYNSLSEPTPQRWAAATHISIAGCFLLMVTFAIGGYATFVDATQSDLFNNYCNSDALITAARVLYAANVLITYPIECFVLRGKSGRL